MSLFAPHLRRSLRCSDDFRALRRAGVTAVVEPASFPGRLLSDGDGVEDQAATLLGWERFRAGLFGVRHHAALCLDPREETELGLGRLHRYLKLDGVVAVGEIGVESLAPEEERRLSSQLDLARRHKLPAWLRVPASSTTESQRQLVTRLLSVVEDAGLCTSRVVLGNLDAESARLVLDADAWASCPISFDSSEDARRSLSLVRCFGDESLLVDGGPGGLLSAPRLAARLRDHGLGDSWIDTLFWQNPIRFFAESGRLAVVGNTPAVQASESLDEPPSYFGARAGRAHAPMLR